MRFATFLNARHLRRNARASRPGSLAAEIALDMPLAIRRPGFNRCVREPMAWLLRQKKVPMGIFIFMAIAIPTFLAAGDGDHLITRVIRWLSLYMLALIPLVLVLAQRALLPIVPALSVLAVMCAAVGARYIFDLLPRHDRLSLLYRVVDASDCRV